MPIRSGIGSVALCFSARHSSLFRRLSSFVWRRSLRLVGRFFRAGVLAQIIDQGIAVGGVYARSPFFHLGHFFGPSGVVETLVQNDAGFVAFCAGGERL